MDMGNLQQQVKKVFCYQKLFWPFTVWKFSPFSLEFQKFFSITRTIFSHSERSEQFLLTECFLTCSWRFLISNKLEQLEFKLEKIVGI